MKYNERGFTFMELIVVMAIFAILASITIFNFSVFSRRISLDNTAEDAALALSTAQHSALSGSINASNVSVTSPAFGVYFQASTLAGTVPATGTAQYTFFNDLNNDYLFDTGDTSAITLLPTGAYLKDICYIQVNSSATTPTCIGANSSSPAWASVVFKRPMPDATMYISLQGPNGNIQVQSLYIKMDLASDPTTQRTIYINALGQVRVYNG